VLANPHFSNGDFNGNTVRYVNLDLGANYSLDYIVKAGTVVFGNSKNMARMVLPLVKTGAPAE
jgi:hypothetical protein